MFYRICHTKEKYGNGEESGIERFYDILRKKTTSQEVVFLFKLLVIVVFVEI